MVNSEILSLFISLQREDDRSILWLINAEKVKFTFPNYLSKSNPFWQSAVYMVRCLSYIISKRLISDQLQSARICQFKMRAIKLTSNLPTQQLIHRFSDTWGFLNFFTLNRTFCFAPSVCTNLPPLSIRMSNRSSICWLVAVGTWKDV